MNVYTSRGMQFGNETGEGAHLHALLFGAGTAVSDIPFQLAKFKSELGLFFAVIFPSEPWRKAVRTFYHGHQTKKQVRLSVALVFYASVIRVLAVPRALQGTHYLESYTFLLSGA